MGIPKSVTRFAVGVLLCLSLLPAATASYAATTAKVTPLSMGSVLAVGSWGFANEGSGTGGYAFVDGPANHHGSLSISTAANTDGPYFATMLSSFNMPALTTLTYDVYSVNATTSMPTLQFEVDYDSTDADTTWQGRLNFVPNGPFTPGTWYTFNALSDTAGSWFATGAPGKATCPLSSPCTWTTVKTTWPNLVLASSWAAAAPYNLPGTGRIGFKKGSGEAAPFEGYVDNLVIDSTTYDFEPVSTAYVDASWTGKTLGSDPDGSGPATMYGSDSFDTIQAAINAVGAGGTVYVNAGTYVGELTINKSLSLLGPNATVNPNNGTRGAEAILQPATEGTDPYGTCTAILTVGASNVTVKGFTVDGNNPSLSNNILVNGVDVDACEGIAGSVGFGNIIVENNIVENTTYSGVDLDNHTDSTATSGNYIRYNHLTNIGNSTIGFGIGVLVYDNFYADITNNVFDAVRVGIQTGNYSQANPGSTGSISNNVIHSWRTGIFHNLWYSGASNIPVSNNTISVIDSTGAARWNGILFTSFAVPATISGNTITATAVHQQTVGYMVWNDLASPDLTISGGSVSGANYGVWANNFQGYGPSNGGPTSVTIDGVSISGASLAGVYVQDDAANTNNATVHATITNSPISNSTVAVLVEGSDALANGSCNQISGNTSGVNNTTDATLDFAHNWWGAASGPSGAGAGSGDAVSANVNYTPWYMDTSCSTSTSDAPPVITEGASTDVSMSEDGAPIPFGLTLHATDANVSDTLIWSIATPAAHGTASASGTGASNAIGYVPALNYNGSDSFVVRVSDGIISDTILVNITITAVNDLPVITEGTSVAVTMSENSSPLAFNLTLHASDVDAGDILTWSIVTPASDGTASASGVGVSKTIGYSPADNFSGSDSFVVQVSDGHGGTATIAVNVTVNAVNNPPTDIALSSTSVNENQPVGTAIGILSTGGSNAGNSFTYSLVTGGSDCSGVDNTSFQISGSTLQTNAVFDYETRTNYSICIQTDDGHAGFFQKAFTITINNLVEPGTVTFTSIAAQDGWILESSELSNMGGWMNSKGKFFQLGDDASKRQYRAILSFDTSTLPVGATIQSVTLRIRSYGAVVGKKNLFSILGNLLVDIRTGAFGGSPALQLKDFNAPASATKVAIFSKTPQARWYTATFNATGMSRINRTGLSQLRVRFAKDDNNDLVANYLRFLSGNAPSSGNKPQLVITYTQP